jgi:hypothetical protein
MLNKITILFVLFYSILYLLITSDQILSFMKVFYFSASHKYLSNELYDDLYAIIYYKFTFSLNIPQSEQIASLHKLQ